MYKIKGYDRQEYGPVSEQELRQWITQGRANAQTMAQREGDPEWKLLSTFPEFSSLFPGSAQITGVPPAMGRPPLMSQDAEGLAAEIIARGYTVDIGSCISRSFELVKNNIGLTVLTTFIVFLVMLPFAFILSFVVGRIMPSTYLSTPVSSVLNGVLNGVFMGGLYSFYLKLIRGEPAGVGDGFAGFTRSLVPLMLTGVISTTLTWVGMVCCILPGIYLAVVWMFSVPLVIDKGLDFWPAMDLSRRVVNKQWWQLFALALLAGLIGAAGLLGCVIGVFITMPIAIGAIAYAYEDIFSPGGAKTP